MLWKAACAWLAAVFLAGPARAADEIHWTFTGPTSVAIDWRGAGSGVRYGITIAYGSIANGETPSPLPFSSPGPFWEAALTGLEPATTYHYSVDGGPDHVFRTPPAPGESFTVYVEGDIGDSSSYSRMGAVQKLIADGGAAFVLVVGDLTYGNAHGQPCVDNHFNNVMKWSQDAGYMPAWGNHEWDGSTDDLRNYKGRFALPNPQGSPGSPSAGCCGEDWSWFDAGNTRFISYPEPYPGAWPDWNTRAKALMDAAEANPSIQFIVTFGHRPAYSTGHHAGNSTLRSYLDALGASHSKYVLNLNGHSHDYERTFPQYGVTHVTVGIGGSTLEESSPPCLYGTCPAPPWSAYRCFHHGALRLRFTPSAIQGEALCGPPGDSGSNLNDVQCSPGDVMDAFLIGADARTDSPPAPAGERLSIESVTPNPSRSPLRVAYSLPEDAPAFLELVDLAGRRWLRRDMGSAGRGHHETSLALDGLPGPGVFWLHLAQARQHTVSKLIFIR